ncbi:putative O-methyltransferase domain, S-adenosyl-L-methionine-dependent methyltransferase [Helianthus annuus]|nr:putative O-methyltransferase domain, S-adenosyl-L-methionine-dependent methyltransferase [Helianthus annuus]KAJ0646282.1 putative O-methyltransferase domain, S-adenosyl-L-methionine-dependent methyltransferase [Helianthus annuus]
MTRVGHCYAASVTRPPDGVSCDDQEGKGYLLAPASRLLLKDEPLSVRPFLLLVLDPILVDPWQHMSKWFQNNDVTPFHTTHGRMFWDLAGQEPKLNQLFNEAMASDARLVTSVILKHCGGVFEGIESIIDVGGGTGTFAVAIAKAFPNIRCISFDLPDVVNGLVGSKNLSYVGGDMFEAIPKADALLFKILKRCKEAIPSKDNGGKLIIIDMVVKVNKEENELLETQLLFDMLMMSLVTGRERNEKDWAKLLVDAGYTDYKITPILGFRSVIEVYP